MLHPERNSTMPHAVGVELARRQAATLGCGFSAAVTRRVVQNIQGAGAAWAISAHRETGKARGARAFPFRIAAMAS